MIIATHAPILMADPNARLLGFTKYGLEPVTFETAEHYRLMRDFCADPTAFVVSRIKGD